MIVDEDGRLAPSASGIFKVADQFTLFRIHADYGMLPTLKTSSKLRDIFKLPITVWTGVRGKHLVVDAERVAHLVKQAGYGIG